MTTPTVEDFIQSALTHVATKEAEEKAESQAYQQREENERTEIKATILKDLAGIYPQLAEWAEYITVENLRREGVEYPTDARLLLRFPQCELVFLGVQRFNKTSQWTLTAVPFLVYPDIDEFWDYTCDTHSDLLTAIAAARTDYESRLAFKAKQARDLAADAQRNNDLPAELEMQGEYIACISLLQRSNHPLPLGDSLSDHLRGLLRRLAQCEMYMLRNA